MTTSSDGADSIDHVALGASGVSASAIGMGCMGFSHIYGPADDEESVATIQRALSLGITLFDTADVYGFNANERLLGQALAGVPRDRYVLATKFGMKRKPDGTLLGVDGTPAYSQTACEESLKRLNAEHIDLLYLHRPDPDVPLEESVGGMARLVEQGKVRAIGLCEVGPSQIRLAHAEHPIAAVQSEYSLWTRDVEAEVLPVLDELGVAFVAYSPLGRGMLSGKIQAADDLAERDYRRTFPRYQGENLAHNAALVDALRARADARGISVAQLSLAWLLAQPGPVIPIPGTRRQHHLADNAAAAGVRLSPEEATEIGGLFDHEAVRGERYRPSAMARVSKD